MNYTVLFLLVLIFQLSIQLELIKNNVTYIIFTQNSDYNKKNAKDLKNSIIGQYNDLNLPDPLIYISPEAFNISDDWTLISLIPELSKITTESNWFIFLQDNTQISINIFLDVIKQYNAKEEIWIGHAINDSEPTIIHHFAFYDHPQKFYYPNLGSGIVLSRTLIDFLTPYIENSLYKKLDFHIDPAHEFALILFKIKKNLMIKHNEKFCVKENDENYYCATYPKSFKACSNKTDISSVYFAVKTCSKFYEDRVEIVKNTWYDYAIFKTFFSDIDAPHIPAISLGVPNTELGHCQKTFEIFKYLLKEFENNLNLEWVALVDDDTILSVSRIAKLLTCFKSKEPLILGEKYRFGAQEFDYPTGGAGILINKEALKILTLNCKCPRSDAPDDMVLGICAQDLDISLIHIPQMHQARPNDYATDRLANNDAVTFHKHWMIDPVHIYNKWFLEDDQRELKTIYNDKLEL